MSSKPPPVIPPRPARSPNSLASSNSDAPKIPPRPRRRPEQSSSPNPERYAPSPLNEPPNKSEGSEERRTSEQLAQQPSVANLSSVEQERAENESQNEVAVSDNDSQIQQPAERRSIDRKLHLHAPRPSLPTSSAKAQVQAVTRMDSRQAVAAGLEASISPRQDEVSQPGRPKTADSQRGSSPDRRGVSQFEEHGIPQIGQRVPMYPNAGDVQAPTPESPSSAHKESSRQGRQQPRPGSYGLHGHGVHPKDKFEKAWYDKHPDEFVREEEGHSGPGVGSPRPDWALSSDDLNKIVRETAQRHTKPEVMGTPEEEIGYIAADELASRFASPRPVSRGYQTEDNLAGESPLKKTSFPEPGGEERGSRLEQPAEHEKEIEIHVDDPVHHQHHPDGFMPALGHPKPHGHESLEGGGTPDDEPILAPDEVAPDTEHLHPAVSPTLEQREGVHAPTTVSPSVGLNREPSAKSNRSSGQPLSSPGLSRFNSQVGESEDTHEPVQDVEKEYEPLFPEDKEEDGKIVSPQERFRQRPEFQQHRFPSKDIWEEAPSSLQLQTTVSMPETPKDEPKFAEDIPDEKMERSKTAEAVPARTPGHLPDAESPQPDLKQRFTSKDVHEEAPDSQQLETTVQPAKEETKLESPEGDQLETISQPSQQEPEALSSDSHHLETVVQPTQKEDQPVPATAPKPSPPVIPSRPSKRAQQAQGEEKPISPPPIQAKKPPAIPGRPKPQVPQRPPRPAHRISEEKLAKVTSKDSAEAIHPPPVKPKPAVPSRPVGSKIAAMQAGFLSDLNNRLKQGYQEPKPPEKNKEDEPPVEKGPLKDARKGRARGPARRKPAVVAAPTVTKVETPRRPQISLIDPWDMWSVGRDGVLLLSREMQAKERPEKQPSPPDVSMAETEEAEAASSKTTDHPSPPEPKDVKTAEAATGVSVAETGEAESASSKITDHPSPPAPKDDKTMEALPEPVAIKEDISDAPIQETVSASPPPKLEVTLSTERRPEITSEVEPFPQSPVKIDAPEPEVSKVSIPEPKAEKQVLSEEESESPKSTTERKLSASEAS